MAPSLRWDIFVTPSVPIVTRDKPPGVTETVFQPIAATLIYGEHDSVLVDAFLTEAQAVNLADWVASHGKKLTTIYITHGHADHWYGLGTLLRRFPDARAVATAGALGVIRQQASPDAVAYWKEGFPGQIPENLVMPEALERHGFELEGHELVSVELGHTDTDFTTCLFVPSIKLAVAGDAVYNGVHPYLAESSSRTRREWMAALDRLESLQPRAVVASHKRRDAADDPATIGETRRYIREFDRLASSASSARGLYDAMLERYPNRENPHWALWGSARSVMRASVPPATGTLRRWRLVRRAAGGGSI